jgi:hypothetical protein
VARTISRDALTLCAAMTALAACRTHTPPLEPRLLPELATEVGRGDLVGFVLDSVTGLPIANAMITLRRDSSGHSVPLARPVDVVADSLGRFHLTAVPPGAYALVARFIGYRTRLVSVRLTDSTSAVVTLALGRYPLSCPENMPKGALCY